VEGLILPMTLPFLKPAWKNCLQSLQQAYERAEKEGHYFVVVLFCDNIFSHPGTDGKATTKQRPGSLQAPAFSKRIEDRRISRLCRVFPAIGCSQLSLSDLHTRKGKWYDTLLSG
jgi:hypothetical protein